MNDDPSHNPDDLEPSKSGGDPVPPPSEQPPPPGQQPPPPGEQPPPPGEQPPSPGDQPPPPREQPPSPGDQPPPLGEQPPSPGEQPPPPAGYGQQPPPPPPYGYGPPTPPLFGQQPPPYGNGQPPPPPYGYGPQTPAYEYFDPTGPWGPYPPGSTDPLVSTEFTGWWNRSFHLLKAAWRPLVGVQLFSVVPIAVVNIGARLTLGRTAAHAATVDVNGRPDFHALLAPLLATVPVLVATFLVSLIVPLASMHVVVRTATGRPASVTDALLAGLRRVLPMLGWGLLGALITGVGLLFCVLPGLYMAAALAILPVIVLLERGQGIGRSFQLFHTDFGAAMGRLLTMFGLSVIAAIAVTVASAVINFGAPADPSMVRVVLTALIGGVFSLASAVVLAPMYVTTYADLRARREPFSTAYLANV